MTSTVPLARTVAPEFDSLRLERRSLAASVVLAVAVLAQSPALASTPTSGPQSDNEGQQSCYAWVEASSLPTFKGISARFGPSPSGEMVTGLPNEYWLEDMYVPEPIPISLSCEDSDTAYLRCTNTCSDLTVGGYWTANWTMNVQGDVTVDQGHFLDRNGQMTQFIMESGDVVYVPPRDLAFGEQRTCKFTARIIDPGPEEEYRDDPVNVEFTVTVWREDAPSYYGCVIEYTPPDLTQQQPEPCLDVPTGCCVFAGPVLFNTGQPIAAWMGEVPDGLLVHRKPDGSYQGDVRMITLSAEDRDTVMFECGVPPNCPSVFEQEPIPDGLTYQWNIVSGSSHAKLIPNGPSAFIEGLTPGKVEIQVTIDDVGGLGGDDMALTLPPFSIYVYSLEFINDINTPLPNLTARIDSEQEEGLQISHEITDEYPGMNGSWPVSQPAVTPTFAGPPTDAASPDRATYRTQGHRGGAPNTFEFKVKLQTTHNWPTGQYEGVPEYERIFDTLTQGGTYRSDLHFRLVSNTVPQNFVQVGGPIPFRWDNAACGDQSILAHPGDWVTAKLLVNDVAVGSRELPVERPWSEPWELLGPNAKPLAAYMPKSIFGAKLRWHISPKGFPLQEPATFHTRRLNEDLAQLPLRTESLSSDGANGPWYNLIFIPTSNQPSPTSGHISIDLSLSAPQWLGLTRVQDDVPVYAGDTHQDVAERVAAYIHSIHDDQTGEIVSNRPFYSPSDVRVFHHPLDTANYSPYVIAVKSGKLPGPGEVSSAETGHLVNGFSYFNADPGTTGVSVLQGWNQHGDFTLTTEDMVALASNFVDPNDEKALEYIVTPDLFIYGLPYTPAQFVFFQVDRYPGITWTTEGGVYDGMLDGVEHTIFLSWLAADSNDLHFPQSVGRQACRFLMDFSLPLIPGATTEAEMLPFLNAPADLGSQLITHPITGNPIWYVGEWPEQTGWFRRIHEAQGPSMLTNMSEYLDLPYIPIPKKK